MSSRFRQTIRYKFDNFVSRGGGNLFWSLVIVSLLVLVVISIVRFVVYLIVPEWRPGEMPDFYRHIYTIFLAMTDPGNMNQDVPSHPAYKFTAILAGMSGVILLSVLIAFITTALDQKIADLKKGHSDVMERDHTLILGWNPERVVEIIRELVIANESEDNPSVVILGEEDKEVMDDFLQIHMPNTQNTRVITRSGKVSAPINLDKVALNKCKSVIVLANCAGSASDEEKASSDAKVIKTTLALLASRYEDVRLNIVAEVFEERNRAIIQKMSPNEVTTVDTIDILAKILVQTSRSIGLSVVYSEILSFDGCEMYFTDADYGSTNFGEIQFHYPDGIPMGIRRADGSIEMNPPRETTLNDGDEILMVAEDDSTIDFLSSKVIEPRDLPYRYKRSGQRIERELILGWLPKVDIIVEQYGDYLLDGSSIDIMVRQVTDTVRRHVSDLQPKLPGINIRLVEKDPMQVANLIAMEPFNYDNIIILSQTESQSDPERTDSETIIILLLLRNIFEDHPEEAANTKLITEILDSENQELVARAGVNDFIISTQLVSMILGQISEAREIKMVYDDLFQEAGSEIYLKPLELYTEEQDIDATFADLMLMAQKRNEVCLGVKIKSLERSLRENFGVKLNPAKDARYRLGPTDCLVVLAEDET